MFGTLLGAATNLPRVSIKSVHASESEHVHNKNAAAMKEGSEKGKGGAGAQCKTTKDCQEDLVCQKAGDHKECTATAVKPPKQPVVT